MSGQTRVYDDGLDETFHEHDESIDVVTVDKPSDKENLYELVRDIASRPYVAKRRSSRFRQVLDTLTVEHLIKLANEDDREGETILHTVIKLFDFKSEIEQRIVVYLIENFPKLLLQDRQKDSSYQHNTLSPYAGQTPLHLAVSKGNVWLVGILMQQLSRQELITWKVCLLKSRACGTMFRQTVMMGELPLTTAALTFNKGMFDLLVEEGAELDDRNRLGDNVCHSLIRYAYLYPDKVNDVMEMCRKICEDSAPYQSSEMAVRNRKLRKKLWLMESNDGMTPLQLATVHGLHQIFSLILNMEGYCNSYREDGLSDIKVYDVTEIDAVSSMTKEELVGVNTSLNTILTPENVGRRNVSDSSTSFKKSVLTVLLELEPKVAFEFIRISPISTIVSQKWRAYRKFFYPAWFIHVVFMSLLTWYAVEKSQQMPNHDDGSEKFDVGNMPVFKHSVPASSFVTAYCIIGFIIGIMHVALELVRQLKGKMPWSVTQFTSPFSNCGFRILFLVFSLCLFVDLFPSIWSKQYENYCLIVANLAGWTLVLFFLRAIRPFSFFITLVQKVMFGDVLRFCVLLALAMLSFSTAMFMSIQGSNVISDTGFQSYGHVLLTNFQLMFGIGEVSDLYNVRHPALCFVIFTCFIILTSVLLITSLIAMAVRTGLELSNEQLDGDFQKIHWRLQQLSVILFIESILPNSWIHKAGTRRVVQRYSNMVDRRKKLQRYFLETRSPLNDEDRVDDECREMSGTWSLKSILAKAVCRRTDHPNGNKPLSGLRGKMRTVFNRWSGRETGGFESSDGNEPARFQVQPPVTHVFGMNPNAVEFGFDEAYKRGPSRDTVDVYHTGRRRSWSGNEAGDDSRA